MMIQSLPSCGRRFWPVLVATFIVTLLSGCSMTIDSHSVGRLFEGKPRWAPTNFVSREIKTLAIVVSVPPGQASDQGVMQPIVSNTEQEFTQACLNKGYQLVSRVRIEAWQKELKIQNIGMTDPAGVSKAGKMLNATHLLIITPSVSVQQQGRHNNLNRRIETYYSQQERLDCQIMEVETARSVAACSAQSSTSSAQGLQDLVSMTARLARRIAEALPDRHDSPPDAATLQGVPKTR